MTGTLLGVISAALLGINAVLLAIAAREWGVWRTTARSLTTAFGVMVAYAVITGTDVPRDATAHLPLLLVLGVAAGASYFATNEALRRGPVSVVSPIGSTTGAMTVVVAFLVLGEQPNPAQWIGIPVATIGVLFLSIDRNRGEQLIAWGPLFAVLGVVAGAISNAVLRIPVRTIGVMPSIVGQRAMTVLFIALIWPIVLRREPIRSRPPQIRQGEISPVMMGSRQRLLGTPIRPWVLLFAIGLIDAGAFLFFAEGLKQAPAWLIGLLSQSGRVIAIAGGFLLFGERLATLQWAGLILTIGGLILAVVG